MGSCEHFTVWGEPGRYGGWPANYGMWVWGNEIVVGFLELESAPSAEMYPASGHKRNKDKPATTMLARSTDGGVTWRAEPFGGKTPGGRALSGDEHQTERLWVGEHLDGPDAPTELAKELDFTHPDFALMCARSGLGKGTRSWFYASSDRCRTWSGPYWLPTFGLPGVEARTDCLVSGPREATFMLTATKSDGEEGRVFCARTSDGARSFRFVSFVGPEPNGYSIMPSSVRLSETRLLCAIRRREGKGTEADRGFCELFGSDDNGASWQFVCEPVSQTGESSNPPAMLRLRDGRLFMTYGYRNAPYGMRARTSEDGGATWSEEIVLRDDGGDGDIGYPRAVQRADGRVVVAYYYDTHPNEERFIASTVVEV